MEGHVAEAAATWRAIRMDTRSGWRPSTRRAPLSDMDALREHFRGAAPRRRRGRHLLHRNRGAAASKEPSEGVSPVAQHGALLP